MFKTNDYVVYKRDVCKIIDIKNEFYVLAPIEDETLTINVPVDNKLGNIKPIISKEEANDIIEEIPNVEIINNVPDKMIENEYKKLLKSGSHRDLVVIIKTTYLRNAKRLANKKKIGEKDEIYFQRAEKSLYNEISKALDMTYDETKEYVINKVNNMMP